MYTSSEATSILCKVANTSRYSAEEQLVQADVNPTTGLLALTGAGVGFTLLTSAFLELSCWLRLLSFRVKSIFFSTFHCDQAADSLVLNTQHLVPQKLLHSVLIFSDRSQGFSLEFQQLHDQMSFLYHREQTFTLPSCCTQLSWGLIK